jgi:hypothetical protein
VDRIAKIVDRARLPPQHNRRRVIRKLALGLGVNADEVQVLPHLFQKVVKVPAVVGRDGHGVRDFVDDVQFLDRDLIDFVENVER